MAGYDGDQRESIKSPSVASRPDWAIVPESRAIRQLGSETRNPRSNFSIADRTSRKGLPRKKITL